VAKKKAGGNPGDEEDARMSVRLQTADGEIKEYTTTDIKFVHVCEGPTLIDKYFTPCGLEWKDKPKPQEECNHLGCAIFLAEQSWKGGLVFSVGLIAIAFMGILAERTDYARSLVCLSILLFAFWVLISVIRARKRVEELTEYRNKGTIQCIKAWQILDDQEVAKAKSWWQF
jgi:hypothetical protein